MGEKIKLKESGKTSFPDGWHIAQVAQANVEDGDYGLRINVQFILHGAGNMKDTTRARFSPSKSTRSKLYTFLGALGINPKDMAELDLDLISEKWVMVNLVSAAGRTGDTIQTIGGFGPAQPPKELADRVAKATRKAQEASGGAGG